MGTRVVMSIWMRGQGVSTLCWACALVWGAVCTLHQLRGLRCPQGPIARCAQTSSHSSQDQTNPRSQHGL